MLYLKRYKPHDNEQNETTELNKNVKIRCQ